MTDVKTAAKKKIDTFLQFSFQMDSIVMNLFTSNENRVQTMLNWFNFSLSDFIVLFPKQLQRMALHHLAYTFYRSKDVNLSMNQ